MKSVLALLSQSCERFPEKPAIIWQDTSITYEQLRRQSDHLAARLIAGGAEKGAPVGIMFQESIGVITAIIGALKAGCVFVPLDPNQPRKRLAMILEEVAPRHMVTEATYADLLQESASHREMAIHTLEPGTGAPASANAQAAPPQALNPALEPAADDPCYIYFTSGSTGKPKGIVGRYKGLNHFINWETGAFGIDHTVRVSQLTNAAFDAFLRDMFVPLCAGGTLCIPDSRDTLLDARRLAEWLESAQINLVHCVPSVFKVLINQDLAPFQFADLKYILMAGERLYPADVKRWMTAFGQRVQLVNLYGPTETTMIKFAYHVEAADAEGKFIPIGQPIPGARALVVSPDGKACPAGSVGEIYIRTPFMTLGYYKQPELTRATFVQNPFGSDPNDLVYKTGDLGRILADGQFEFLGRKDHQVKIRGVRVELGEIEGLLRQHDSVRDAAVTEARDSGSNESYLCAYIVPRHEMETESLKAHLTEHLPPAAVPAVYMKMDALPLLLNGKVDRRSLPTPEKTRSRRAAFIAPRTPAEAALTDIWKGLLGIQQISVIDNFFDLGGHSLLATQLVSRVREGFDIDLQLATLFDNPTIEGLALVLASHQSEPTSDEEIARMVAELEQLSDDDARTMLAS